MRESSIKLEGEALEVAKEMDRQTQEVELHQREMHARYQAEWEEFTKGRQQTLDDLYLRLEALTGVPVRRSYHIDVSYLRDHGDAYLRPRDQDEQPSGISSEQLSAAIRAAGRMQGLGQ